MKEINLLLPKVQVMANDFVNKCAQQGHTVIITSTYRDEKEQNALYAQGRTKPGNVVTNAKFGDSMHNYRCALDFAPVDAFGNIPWGNKALFTKIGAIGKLCGFEWGGDWVSFLDLPHLQYTAGYTLKDFQNKKVDYSKFDIEIKANRVEDFLKSVQKYQVESGILDFKDAPVYKVTLGKKTLMQYCKDKGINYQDFLNKIQ